MNENRGRRIGSKKVWLALVGVFTIAGLSVAGKGDAAAFGAIGLIITTAVGAIGAGDYRKIGANPPSDMPQEPR